MADMFPPSIDEQIASVEREIRMRESVYPRWVQSGKMNAVKADREIETMKEVVKSLYELKGRK